MEQKFHFATVLKLRTITSGSKVDMWVSTSFYHGSYLPLILVASNCLLFVCWLVGFVFFFLLLLFFILMFGHLGSRSFKDSLPR